MVWPGSEFIVNCSDITPGQQGNDGSLLREMRLQDQEMDPRVIHGGKGLVFRELPLYIILTIWKC